MDGETNTVYMLGPARPRKVPSAMPFSSGLMRQDRLLCFVLVDGQGIY